MKAIVLDALGGSEHFRLAEVSTPSPSSDQIRIKISAAAFNPLDYKLRQGRYKGPMPAVLGADCAGVIDAVGAQVTGWEIGEEVYAFMMGPCSNGAYAEYTCLSPAFIARKPNKLSFEQAASVPLTALTAYRAICANRILETTRAIYIAGATGGVGTMAVQMARHLGADPIFVTAGSAASRHYLHETLNIPLEHILDYTGRNLDEMRHVLLRMNKGRLIPIVCDFVGKDMKLLCMAIVDYSGHMVTIVEEKQELPNLWNREVSPLFQKSAAVHFVFVGAEAILGDSTSWQIYQDHLMQISRMIVEDALHIPQPQILDGLSVENVRLAHSWLEDGHLQGKVVMRI